MESLFFPTFAGKLVAGVTIKQKFMQKNLVIVESPAKAKTIEKFLGKDYKVLSSYGHIRDLKKKEGEDLQLIHELQSRPLLYSVRYSIEHLF